MEFKTDVLLHGGDYNPDQWLDRPDILAEDIRLMKEAHVNCASLGIFAWSKLEPEEGVYDLDWLGEIIDRLYEQGRASDPKHGSRQSVWSKKLHDITEYFVLGATNSVYKFSQHIAGDHVILEFYLSPDYYEPLYFANSLVDLLRYCQCSIRRIEAKLAERETENIRKEAA